MKKYQYLASWDDQTLTRVGEPVVVLGDSNVSQVEVTLPSDFLLDPTKAECRMYFLLPGEKESAHDVLETAVKDENGDSHVTWTIKHVHSQKGGRLAFSLTLIGDDAQWDSRTAIIPVYESRYQPESEEAEEPYTGRLDALEGSMAAIRGEFAEVQDDFEELKETATLGTPIPESLVANMTEGHVYIYTGTEPGYTAGHVYYYVGGTLTDGGVYGGVNVDTTLTQSGQAADAKVTGDEISQIKEDLNEIWSEQIVGMTDTGVSTVSSNLFQYATMIGYHKLIYNISGGKVVLSDATSSNTYLIPVDGVSTYTFTFCRSAVVVSDAELTAVGSILNNVQSVNSAGGKCIVFSFNTETYLESSYEVTKLINKYKIPKNWDFEDVEIRTPQIDGMLPTGKTVQSSSLFPSATLIYTGKYVDRIVDGKAYFSDSTNLDTYLLPVDGSTTYSFTYCRTALLVSDLEYTAVGTVLSYVTDINTTGAAYVLFSFNRNTYPPNSYVVTHPIAQYTIPADWNLQRDHKNQYQINTGSIADGGSLALTGKTAVKFGQRIVFKGVITSFSQIKLAFYNYNNSSVINSIIVDSTNLYVYSGITAVQTWAHGLTITHDISLIVDYLKDNVQISLESNGTIYKNTATWSNLTSGVASVSAVSTGTVCTSAILLMAIPEALKPIWYFGDSYISHTNQARWTYYLLDYGFDKGTLLNGYAGGTSATSIMALTALLGYGTPKFAVFATGMNDGSDSESAPSTSWVNARDNFISLCENNGIEMVFATVPTVPSVNNEQKNAWVRSSGYRYIDFASAVGADGTGAWYAGMLSADNVHPTEKGAIALFTQVLIDLPEIMTDA